VVCNDLLLASSWIRIGRKLVFKHYDCILQCFSGSNSRLREHEHTCLDEDRSEVDLIIGVADCIRFSPRVVS
jgi:hypothetical protein